MVASGLGDSRRGKPRCHHRRGARRGRCQRQSGRVGQVGKVTDPGRGLGRGFGLVEQASGVTALRVVGAAGPGLIGPDGGEVQPERAVSAQRVATGTEFPGGLCGLGAGLPPLPGAGPGAGRNLVGNR